MIFSSIDFLIFIVIVLFTIKRLEHNSESSKKIFLLLASYFFYGYWDWRFLSLILINTFVSYYSGRKIQQNENQYRIKKLFLMLNIVTSLGILAVFKYYNFFIESINTVFSLEANPLSSLDIILPLGISFYTFQTLSYTIDIYRGKIKPANLLDFSLFVVFFPQLVAGPIVRAAEFLPQLKNKIELTFPHFKAGLVLFIIGFTKKSLLADSLSIYADTVFNAPHLFDSVTLVFAVMAYSLQIYFDFSGYSDMAIGLGLILGFHFPKNFAYPYKARNITEFWRRWHLTLSRWLRDYLYISLGGNRKGTLRTYLNLFLTMTLGGLWHGASLNFVVWGMLHGMALALHKVYLGIIKVNINDYPEQAFTEPRAVTIVHHFVSITITYIFLCITWVFFRANSFDDTYNIFAGILSNTTGAHWVHISFYFIVPLFLFWQMVPHNENIRKKVFNLESYSGFTACSTLVVLIVLFSPTGLSPFIYFQF